MRASVALTAMLGAYLALTGAAAAELDVHRLYDALWSAACPIPSTAPT